MYIFLSVIAGPIIVLFFALAVGVVSFMYTYLVAPAVSLAFICMIFFSKIYRGAVHLVSWGGGGGEIEGERQESEKTCIFVDVWL